MTSIRSIGADEYPGVSRKGAELVVTVRGAHLPDRCVKCNAPMHKQLERQFSWHQPLYYIVVLISPIIYIIVALIVSKKARIGVPLCEQHYSRRRKAILIGWGAALLGVAAIFLAACMDTGWFALVAVVLILVGIVWGFAGSRLLTPTKIDEEVAFLKGVSPELLDSLPQYLG